MLPTCHSYEDAQGGRCAAENLGFIKASSFALWMRKLEHEIINFMVEGHTAGQNQSQELKKWLRHVIRRLGPRAYLNHRLWVFKVISEVTHPKLAQCWEPSESQTDTRPALA